MSQNPAINCKQVPATPMYRADFVPFMEPYDPDNLWLEMPWETRTEARKECFFNLSETEYTYGTGKGQRTYTPASLDCAPALVMFAWELVNNEYGFDFEALFINGYEHQHHHLGWHADDAEMIDHTKPIVVVSFGAERQIWTRAYENSQVVDRFSLGNGSLFEMPPGFQHTHQHRIPKHDRPCGSRISLTFRALN